jgi:hypothetical protein
VKAFDDRLLHCYACGYILRVAKLLGGDDTLRFYHDAYGCKYDTHWFDIPCIELKEVLSNGQEA